LGEGLALQAESSCNYTISHTPQSEKLPEVHIMARLRRFPRVFSAPVPLLCRYCPAATPCRSSGPRKESPPSLIWAPQLGAPGSRPSFGR
jgi:hypothetical protein